MLRVVTLGVGHVGIVEQSGTLSETGERMHAVGYDRDLHNDPPSLRIYSRTILVAGERRIEPGSSTREPSEGVGPPQLAGTAASG